MTTHPQRRLTIAVLVVMLVAGVTGVMLASGNASTTNDAADLPSTAQPYESGPTRHAALSRSRPVTLAIPRIGLTTPLVTLDATREGMMELPPVKRAGWYTGSVTPGEIGIAVVAGYIRRSTTAPGIFKDLNRLRTGDHLVVDRADGSSADFRVTRIESYDKGAFPTAQVYAGGDEPELRLVTTGGALRSGDPLGNVAVFARLADRTTDAQSGP